MSVHGRPLFARFPRGWRRFVCRLLGHRDESWDGQIYVIPWTGQDLGDDGLWEGAPATGHAAAHCTRCGRYVLGAPPIPAGEPMAVRFVYAQPGSDLDIRVGVDEGFGRS